MKNVGLLLATAVLVAVLLCNGSTAVVQTKYIPLVQQEEPSVRVETDENGTVYISFAGLSVYKYVKTQIGIGWYNSSYIYVSYTGLYVDSPEEDLVPVKVELYNGTGDTKVLKYVFNATNFTEMQQTFSGVVFKISYYNVSGFTNITYIVYNMTNASNPSIIYEGVLPPPPTSGLTAIYGNAYMSYLASLIPLSLLILFAGRGKPKDVGLGCIIYGIVILLLPYIGIYPAYSTLLFSLSIIIGIIILFFSR